MRNLIKIFITVTLFTAFTVAANAQVGKVQFSIGPDAGLLTGPIKQSHSGMLGGSVQVAVPLNKTLFFTAAGGYNYFFGKQNVDLQLADAPLIDYLGIKSVPVKLGLKNYFNPLFISRAKQAAHSFPAVTIVLLRQPYLSFTLLKLG